MWSLHHLSVIIYISLPVTPPNLSLFLSLVLFAVLPGDGARASHTQQMRPPPETYPQLTLNLLISSLNNCVTLCRPCKSFSVTWLLLLLKLRDAVPVNLLFLEQTRPLPPRRAPPEPNSKGFQFSEERRVLTQSFRSRHGESGTPGLGWHTSQMTPTQCSFHQGWQ